MKGYKVFNPDWTCRGFQFEVGKTFTENVEPKCCERGFHFCTKLVDCFNYYSFNSNNKVAEVEALGKVDADDKNAKHCTNKIRIVRELSWHEVLDLVNTGANNTGKENSGNWNSGNWNSGNWNSGDGNSGNWNSGDGNSGNYNMGCFNTKDSKIHMFDKPTDWTLYDWFCSKSRQVMNNCPFGLKWIESENMTDDEKEKYPEHKVTGGFLRMTTNEQRQEWWDNLSELGKKLVLNLPNFDSKIFKEITGITV